MRADDRSAGGAGTPGADDAQAAPDDDHAASAAGGHGVHDAVSRQDARLVEQWPTGRLLSAVSRRVERDWDTWLSAWSLSHATLPVLHLLSEAPRSGRDLALALAVTDQTMSRMLVRLEKHGYVKRAPDPADRRRMVASLTAVGAAVLASASDPEPIEKMATEGLDEEQVRSLRAALIALLARDRPLGP